MIAALVLLVILLVLSPLASQIPAAVLAGILVTVGIGVMDYKGLNALSKIPRTEVIIMAVVLLLSVFWNLVYAVGIGLVLASLFFMKKMGDLGKDDTRVTTVAKENMWDDEKNSVLLLKKMSLLSTSVDPYSLDLLRNLLIFQIKFQNQLAF